MSAVNETERRGIEKIEQNKEAFERVAAGDTPLSRWAELALEVCEG
jgi:hypothetical protein